MDLDEYLWKTRTTQLQFAQKLGVYPHTINRICQKKTSPKLLMAIRIVEATEGQVTYKDLLRKEDAEKLEK